MSATPAAGSQAEPRATPQAGEPTPTPPQAGKSSELEALTPQELATLVRDLRKESGGYRTKLAAYEKAEQERRQTELSEVERRDARIRELEEAVGGHERRAREYALRDAVAAVVASDEFPLTPVVGTRELLKLLDTEQVAWAADGTPTNAGTVLASLARGAPALFQAKPRRPGPSDGGNFPTAPLPGDMNQAIRRAAGRG